MKSRIFISSVQREFARERKALASYIRQDAILGKFFEVFLFEEVPAQERKADGVYLPEVDECKYVEQTGTGTGDIIARCREWGLPDPQWQVEDGDDFVMIMPRPQSSVKSSVRTVDKSVDWSVDKSVDWNVDRTCDQVLNILKTNPRATLDQVANVVGLSVRGIEQAIKRLKKAKRIRKVGGKRFGHWEVVE